MSFPQSTLTTLTTLFHSNISSQDYTENFLTNLPTHTTGFESALSGIEHLKSFLSKTFSDGYIAPTMMMCLKNFNLDCCGQPSYSSDAPQCSITSHGINYS